MIIRALFHLIGSLLLLLSCGGVASKQTQGQKKDTLSNEKIQIDTITYDTINSKIMKSKDEHKVIKRFDIEHYNRQKPIDHFSIRYEFVDRDGMLVTQEHDESESDGEYYIDERHYPNSAYSYTCMYNSEGYITLSLTRFYGIYIGKIYNYDTSGKITKEFDKDAPYKFSVDDLIIKMKREYNIDVENKEEIWSVSRYATDNSVFYEVYVKSSYSKNIVYLISGTNGKTLYTTECETEWYPGRSEEAVYQEYKRVKKIK